MSTKPRTVLLIRHAEKPGHPGKDHESDGVNLSTRGKARAAGLAVYVPATFGVPDHLLATKRSKHSNRPVETITPLSERIDRPIHAKHPDDEFAKVAEHVLNHGKYADKLVLICWHHGTIPELAAALGATAPMSVWPEEVFDRVWRIDYTVDGQPVADPTALPVDNLPQKLLFGDAGA